MEKLVIWIILLCAFDCDEATKMFVPKRACEVGVGIGCDCGGYGECPKRSHCEIGVKKDKCVLDDTVMVGDCGKVKVDMYGRQLELCSCGGDICARDQLCFGLPQKQRCLYDLASNERIIPIRELPHCNESLIEKNIRCSCKNQGECPYKTHCSNRQDGDRCVAKTTVKKCSEVSEAELAEIPCKCGVYGFCPYDYYCDYSYGPGECVLDKNGFIFDEEFDEEEEMFG